MNIKQKREIVIALLEKDICDAVSRSVLKPEGVTIPEVLIALSDASLRWARELHKEDTASTPTTPPPSDANGKER